MGPKVGEADLFVFPSRTNLEVSDEILCPVTVGDRNVVIFGGTGDWEKLAESGREVVEDVDADTDEVIFPTAVAPTAGESDVVFDLGTLALETGGEMVLFFREPLVSDRA